MTQPLSGAGLQQPSIGRIVIYRAPMPEVDIGAEREHPAIVAGVLQSPVDGVPHPVNLHVFFDADKSRPVTCVLSATVAHPDLQGWRWQERV